MNCRLPRVISITPASITVNISGKLSSQHAYATVGGTTYKVETTLQDVSKGTQASVYVGAMASDLRDSCYVKLNGETVQSGYGTYSFVISHSMTITFGSSGSVPNIYYYAEITTP